MKGMTKAEMKESYERMSSELNRVRVALTFVVGSFPDGGVSFTVGEKGERESYDLKLYGALRADGGTVVQIRKDKSQPNPKRMPDVEAFQLDDLRAHCQRSAAGHPSDFNIKRRDALDQLYALRNDMFNQQHSKEATGGSQNEAPAGA